MLFHFFRSTCCWVIGKSSINLLKFAWTTSSFGQHAKKGMICHLVVHKPGILHRGYKPNLRINSRLNVSWRFNTINLVNTNQLLKMICTISGSSILWYYSPSDKIIWSCSSVQTNQRQFSNQCTCPPSSNGYWVTYLNQLILYALYKITIRPSFIETNFVLSLQLTFLLSWKACDQFSLKLHRECSLIVAQVNASQCIWV